MSHTNICILLLYGGPCFMLMRPLLVLAFFLCPLAAQDFTGILSEMSKMKTKSAKVTGLRFVCIPENCTVAPLGALTVQVLVDGEMPGKTASSAPQKGRLRRSPGLLRLSDPAGGWVSKPFTFPGRDSGGFIDGGGMGALFGQMSSKFTLFDTFLYTASEKPGKYLLQCETDGVKGEITVTVDEHSLVGKPVETVAFPAEPPTEDRFRKLAETYAPVFAQETWWQPKSDYFARFDFDGDWIGDNNWDNLDKGSSQAYVYYAAIETKTHWFLIYNVFHARDYSDKCLAGSCHENDNEGTIVVVERDGTELGRLIAMETLAHNNLYSYTNIDGIRNGVHNIEGRMVVRDNTHPIVFIESGGHGQYGGSDAKYSRYDPQKDTFTGGTGVTFVYKGTAERPKHPNDRNVGYELLPILQHWWPRAQFESTTDPNRTYDEISAYAPLGGRPAGKGTLLGRAFLGRKEAANKAKPFWGWHDAKTTKAKVLAPGQWGLDPAYAFSRNLRFPASMAWSLDYTYNPFLGIE